MLGQVVVCHQAALGAVAAVADLSGPTVRNHLLRAGDGGASLLGDTSLVQVAPVGKHGSPALNGSYLVEIVRGCTIFSADEHLLKTWAPTASGGWPSVFGTRRFSRNLSLPTLSSTCRIGFAPRRQRLDTAPRHPRRTILGRQWSCYAPLDRYRSPAHLL